MPFDRSAAVCDLELFTRRSLLRSEETGQVLQAASDKFAFGPANRPARRTRTS